MTPATARPIEWTIEVAVPQRAVAAVEAALEPFCDAVASFEALDLGRDCWTVTGYASTAPDRAELDGRLAVAAAAEGDALPAPVVAPLPATDWLAENRRSFRPVVAGRYRVIPWDADPSAVPPGDLPPSAGAIVIRLNAGPAFGSGTHESTRGCLLALDRRARRAPPRRVLDLGAGSGILAIAAAKTWQCPVLATDIDPVAAATTRENAAANHVAALVEARTGPGLRPVARRGRFDLIVANIHARPLMALARALHRHATPGAVVILSGVLRRQAPSVLAAYRSHGFVLADRIDLGDWATLVLRRGRGRPRAIHSLPEFRYSTAVPGFRARRRP